MGETTKEKLIFLGVCLVLAIFIYGHTIFGDFVFDDRGIVEHEYLLSNLNNLHRVLALPYWTEEAGLYRPITLASYAFNYVIFGSGPAGFHFVNLFFYALSGYLIFLLISRVFKIKILAYLSSILFLVLPIHTEAVANIVGRAEILALFFSLLFFLELARQKTRPWRAGLWLLLAVASKETAIAALPIALFLIYFKEQKYSDKEISAERLEAKDPPVIRPSLDKEGLGGGNSESRITPPQSSPHPRGGGNFRFGIKGRYFYPAICSAAALFIYFGARLLVLGRKYFLAVETSIVENPLKFAPVFPRVVTAFKVLGIYLQKTFWPFGLCSDYSFNQIPVLENFFDGYAIFGFLAFLFFCLGIILFLRRLSILSFASVVFLFGFLPVSNLIFATGTIAGERLMYFPSLGLTIYLSAVLIYILSLKPAKIFRLTFFSVSLGIIVFYGILSFTRASDWLSEKRLFVSAARCSPQSVLSRSNLGAAYYLEGNLVEAKKELLLAQGIYDSYPKGVNNLGLIYWKEGDKQKARELFLRALSFKFPYFGAYENLALMALEDNSISEAKDWLIKFYSGNSEAAQMYIRAYKAGQ